MGCGATRGTTRPGGARGLPSPSFIRALSRCASLGEEELRLYAAQTQPGRRILVLAWSREVELLFVRPCSHRQITRQRKRMAGPAPARSADRNGCSAGWTRHGEEGHRFDCLEWESSAVMAPTGYSRQLLLG
jgi:hypothetical protein